jgi:kinetochore protein Spc24
LAELHAKSLNHLDAARLSLAKALNDTESAFASMQADFTRLKEELCQLEESGSVVELELDATL